MLRNLWVSPRATDNLDAPNVTGDAVSTAGLMPCVSYQCASDFIATSVSSNVFELIAIRPENILGKRGLWDDRLRAEDRDRLVSRLDRLAWTETASVPHKIANDGGVFIPVIHCFRKVRTGREFAIHGCLVPLAGELCAATLSESAIPQFIHKIGNHFQLINLLIGSLKRAGANMDEIETLQVTVDRAVEFTRAFSHYSQPPVFTPEVDLAGILHAVIESLAPSCVEQKVVFRQNVSRCLNGAMVTADAYLLELAFTALLQNALDATKSGNRVTLSGRRAKSRLTGQSVARIAIVDNGSGMDKDMLATAADPFVTSKRDRDGLGLSMACRIVECHGGQVKMSSTFGKGTKIEVTLPVKFAGDPFET